MTCASEVEPLAEPMGGLTADMNLRIGWTRVQLGNLLRRYTHILTPFPNPRGANHQPPTAPGCGHDGFGHHRTPSATFRQPPFSSIVLSLSSLHCPIVSAERTYAPSGPVTSTALVFPELASVVTTNSTASPSARPRCFGGVLGCCNVF